MKMHLGYQNAQMRIFLCGVSIAVFKLPPTLGSIMVRRVVGIRIEGTPLVGSVPMRVSHTARQRAREGRL